MTASPGIRHSVAFRLTHAPGSPEEQDFFAAADALAALPGVGNFQRLREVSEKNPFDYVLAMTFADAAAYTAYNEHPDHVAFVQGRWLPEVAEFMEIDTVSI